MKGQLKGIVCIVIAAIGFSFMTFFVRLAGDLPTMQKAFFRNAFALIIAVIVRICCYPYHIQLSNPPNDLGSTSSNLLWMIGIYFSSISHPIKFLPVSLHATAVVPEPKKGSNTISPGWLLFSTIC